MGQHDRMVEWLGDCVDEDERLAKAAVIPAHGRPGAYQPHPELATWRYVPGGEVEYVSTPEMLGREHHRPYRVTADGEGLHPAVDERVGPHIALNDPASALARVAAHRAILAEHAPERQHVEWWDAPDATGMAAVCTSCRPADPTGGDYDPAVEPEGFVPSYTLWPCPTVRHLATVYADRGGYDPSWRQQ